MPHVDPADVDSPRSVSIDLADLHDAALRLLGTHETHQREAAGE